MFCLPVLGDTHSQESQPSPVEAKDNVIVKTEVSSDDFSDGDDACSISSSEEEVPLKRRSRQTKARAKRRSAINRLCKSCGSEFKIQQTMFVDSKDVLCKTCQKSKKSSKSSPQFECEVSFFNCKFLVSRN